MWCFLFTVVLRCESSSTSNQEDNFRRLIGMTGGSHKSTMGQKKSVSESDDDDTSVVGMASSGKELLQNMVKNTSEYDNVQFSVESESKSPKDGRRGITHRRHSPKDSGDSGVSIYDSDNSESDQATSNPGSAQKQTGKGASGRTSVPRNQEKNRKGVDPDEEIDSDGSESTGIRASRSEKIGSKSGAAEWDDRDVQHHNDGKQRSKSEGDIKYPRPSLHPGSMRASSSKHGSEDHGGKMSKSTDGLPKHGHRTGSEKTKQNSGYEFLYPESSSQEDQLQKRPADSRKLRKNMQKGTKSIESPSTKEYDEESSSSFIKGLEGKMKKAAFGTRSR